MALLDCRDTRITLWLDGVEHASPGFALFDGGDYHFGQVAQEQSRLRPRDSNNRYWWQLSTQELKPALGPARHTADLVHAHLKHVHQSADKPAALTLVVPDSMPREQLSLLLGITQACEFEVAGLLSRSVLLASTQAFAGDVAQLFHVEAQLNQTIVNELIRDGDQLRLARSTPLPACGLLALEERCVSAIATAFVQQTRFDPRRAAESEQTLYNGLPAILQDIDAKGEASIEVEGHRCRVSASTFASVSERLLKGINQARSSGAPILLDVELMRLPGVAALEGNVKAIDKGALWTSWSKQRDHIPAVEGDVHLVDVLPLYANNEQAKSGAAPIPEPATTEQPPAQKTEEVKANTSQATHVLLGVKAVPLRDAKVPLGDDFVLHRENGHWTLHGQNALINGLPANPHQPLVLGDTLSLGTTGHGRLIEVVD